MTLDINEFLATLLGITLSMSAAIAALLLLRRSMKKRFTAGCRFIIWTLVMLRLCIPIGGIFMPSIISVSLPYEMTEEQPTHVESAPPIHEEELDITPSAPADVPFVIPEREFQCTAQFTPPSYHTVKMPEKEPHIEIDGKALTIGFFSVWAIGAVTFAFVCLANYNISACRIRRTSVDADERVRALYNQLCCEMGIRKFPRLQTSPAVNSPMLYGYFRQTIVLPCVDLSDVALKSVLSHELTHHKRHDIYLKLISMIGNAVHWFNPLVYAAAKTFSAEIELSCDESVLRGCDDIVRISYGQVMLDIIKNGRGTSNMLTTSFNPKSSAVKERFAGILDSSKKGKGRSVISFILALCLVSGSLIGYEVSAISQIIPTEDEELIKKAPEDTTAVHETEALTEIEIQPILPEAEETEKAEETTANEITVSGTAEFENTGYREETTLHQKSEDVSVEPESKDTSATETQPQKKDEPSADTEAKEDEPPYSFSSSADVGNFAEKSSAADIGLPSVELRPTHPYEHTHSYTNVEVPATCCDNGFVEYSCVTCEHSYRVVTYKTDKHVTYNKERTLTVDGEKVSYYAEICKFCGTEIGRKKSTWDGTSISYYISGPVFYEGDYNRDGELVVYGSGPMPKYAAVDDLMKRSTTAQLPAWWLYVSEYDSIRIGDNITSVSTNAFAYECIHVDTIILGKSVTTVEKNAFKGATGVKTVYIPRSLKSLSIDAFGIRYVDEIKYEGSPEEFFEMDLGNLRAGSVEFNVKY